MPCPFIVRLLVCLLILNLDACGDVATLPEQAGIGPRPTLPPPNPTLLPTVNIAPAEGWPAGITPRAAAGLAVNAFATGLDHPRWLYTLWTTSGQCALRHRTEKETSPHNLPPKNLGAGHHSAGSEHG